MKPYLLAGYKAAVLELAKLWIIRIAIVIGVFLSITDDPFSLFGQMILGAVVLLVLLFGLIETLKLKKAAEQP